MTSAVCATCTAGARSGCACRTSTCGWRLPVRQCAPPVTSWVRLCATRIRWPDRRELGELLDGLRQPGELLLPWVAGVHPHHRIRHALRRWVRAACIISPRTGRPLRLSPRRLRYTLATEMAREGASRHKIADV